MLQIGSPLGPRATLILLPLLHVASFLISRPHQGKTHFSESCGDGTRPVSASSAHSCHVLSAKMGSRYLTRFKYFLHGLQTNKFSLSLLFSVSNVSLEHHGMQQGTAIATGLGIKLRHTPLGGSCANASIRLMPFSCDTSKAVWRHVWQTGLPPMYVRPCLPSLVLHPSPALKITGQFSRAHFVSIRGGTRWGRGTWNNTSWTFFPIFLAWFQTCWLQALQTSTLPTFMLVPWEAFLVGRLHQGAPHICESLAVIYHSFQGWYCSKNSSDQEAFASRQQSIPLFFKSVNISGTKLS